MLLGALIASVLLGVLSVVLLTLLLLRDERQVLKPLTESISNLHSRSDQLIRDEFGRNREEVSKAARETRGELSNSFATLANSVSARLVELIAGQKTELEAFSRRLQESQIEARSEQARFRTEVSVAIKSLSEGLQRSIEAVRTTVDAKLHSIQSETSSKLGEIRHTVDDKTLQMSNTLSAGLEGFGKSVRESTDLLKQGVETRLQAIQNDNAAKLEQIRQTVDDKLHSTLEQRLSDSFKLVSERLEQVHNGLGEMRALASGVGDLKKVLSNVKTRGNWGEVQLGNLLEQMLTPDQFAKNVSINPDSGERVEFAIKLPGRENDSTVWLPIDAKFPQEDYQQLMQAAEQGDGEAIASHAAALEKTVLTQAKKIREKYINPPSTTDFAILFLPTEGLFAEVLRKPGACDRILAERVVIAGPTTLAALLTSLQMGFRSIAIEKRSSEVWAVLGAVKTEFMRFGDALTQVENKLQQASNKIGNVQVRSRALARKLREVQGLPEGESATVLQLPPIVIAGEAGLRSSDESENAQSESSE